MPRTGHAPPPLNFQRRRYCTLQCCQDSSLPHGGSPFPPALLPCTWVKNARCCKSLTGSVLDAHDEHALSCYATLALFPAPLWFYPTTTAALNRSWRRVMMSEATLPRSMRCLPTTRVPSRAAKSSTLHETGKRACCLSYYL